MFYLFPFSRYALKLTLAGYKIDLPPEYGTLDKYRATLGHKSNHNRRNNAIFHRYNLHPELGQIMSLVAVKDIPEGEEIFTNYGYSKDIFEAAGISNNYTHFVCIKVR